METVILILGAVTAVCVFLWLYLSGEGRAPGALVLLAGVLSLLFARLCHWYFRPDAYESLWKALTDFSQGGYALMGVFFGSILAAAGLGAAGILRDLPEALDCMAIAGAAGIAVGRLASMCGTSDHGMRLEGAPGLPWAHPIVNPASGLLEYRFATFLFQALAAGAVFGVLLWLRKKKHPRPGDAFLLFLTLYGASQILLDSTRYDGLYLRSNGFVSAVQVLCALALVFAAGVYTAKAARAWPRIVLAWLDIGCGLGLAGYMEYYVQRHGDRAVLAYSVMALALAAAVLGVLLLRRAVYQEIPVRQSDKK